MITDRRKRVLIVQYALGVGGGGMQAARLAEALADDDGAGGFDVDILAMADPDGDAARRLRHARVVTPDADGRVAHLTGYDHIDVCMPASDRHCHIAQAAQTANPAASTSIRFHAEAAFTDRFPGGFARLHTRSLIASADALIFHHAAQAREVLAGFALDRPAVTDKVALVRPGVDLDRFRPGGTDARAVARYARQFDLGGKLVVGMAGRPAGEKNWPDYVILARRLRDTYGDRVVCLAITGPNGPGPGGMGVLPAVARLNGELGSPVRVTGLLADWQNLLASVDVYVQMSCTESFCRTAAEASACGIPVVATGVGGLAALAVEHERTGICVPPQSGHRWLARLTERDRAAFYASVRVIADNPGVRGRMGDAGAKRMRSDFDDRETLAAERQLIRRLTN